MTRLTTIDHFRICQYSGYELMSHIISYNLSLGDLFMSKSLEKDSYRVNRLKLWFLILCSSVVVEVITINNMRLLHLALLQKSDSDSCWFYSLTPGTVMRHCYVLAALALLLIHVHCEVFSSLATLAKALENERALATVLREYVEMEKTRLDQVLRYVFETLTCIQPLLPVSAKP